MSNSMQKVICLGITAVVLITALSGCSNKKDKSSPSYTENEDIVETALPEATKEPTAVPTSTPTVSPTIEPTATPGLVDGLTMEQRNSINMLNYLAVLTQEINASSNSRVFLENAYSSLINNTDPQAVDSRTLSELTGILDTLESYRMIAVKRERIEYIYEQNQAQAVRAAMPNPLALLSAVKSANLASLVTSVVYMAVDSFTSYESAMSSADLQYLQDGWALDDEEAEALHERRKETFSYMTRIVADYGLPGKLALSEEAVENLVTWQQLPVVRRIQMLEDTKETYQAYGGYWLALLESYYENGDYDKCIEAMTAYEQLGISIYRYDHQYAKMLPLAIIAANEVNGEGGNTETVSRYIKALVDNTQLNEWALIYFAAQAYVELYANTGDRNYLEAAYSLTRTNVNCLINEQNKLNDAYLAPVQKESYPADATKAQKEEIDKYNKLLEVQRQTELPPVYEPLLLNIELLYALADELEVSEDERTKIGNIIYSEGNSIFLTAPLDELHRSGNDKLTKNVEDTEIIFSGKEMEIPVKYLTDNYSISVTVNDGEQTHVFSDWKVKLVSRETEGDINSFTALLESEEAGKFKFKAGMTIEINVIPTDAVELKPITFDYEVTDCKSWGFISNIQFLRK